MTYRACLLGAFSLRRGDQAAGDGEILPLTSAAARSLLAYLLLRRGKLQPRPVLAGTFWPDDSEDHARRMLTQALWHIRSSLPDLVATQEGSLGIGLQAPVWVDVEEFLRLSNPMLPAVPATLNAAESAAQIRRALSLCIAATCSKVCTKIGYWPSGKACANAICYCCNIWAGWENLLGATDGLA